MKVLRSEAARSQDKKNSTNQKQNKPASEMRQANLSSPAGANGTPHATKRSRSPKALQKESETGDKKPKLDADRT